MAKRRPKSRAGASATTRVDKAVDSARSAEDELAIPLPEEGYGSAAFWSQEVEASVDRLKKELPGWVANQSRYDGEKPSLPGISVGDTVNVNVQYYVAEQKKPMMFHQAPTLAVKGLRPETAPVAPIVKAIMDAYLGEDEIDAVSLMDEVLNDIIIPAGIGPTKIGYESVTIQVKIPTGRMTPVLDEATGQPLPKIDDVTGMPATDPMSGAPQFQETLATDPDGQPETEEQPKKLFCRYYWDRVSPDDILIPVGFLSTRYDDAPWLGFRFYADADELKRRYNVEPATFADIAWSEKLVTGHDRDALEKRSVACGYEIWYKAHLYDGTEPNPERVRRIVLLAKKGNRTQQSVVIHENSPWQRFDQVGKFLGGMRGFPLHIFTLRSRVNSAYPRSDCAVIRDVADEKCMGRSQMVAQRKRSMPMRGINIKSPSLTRDTVEQIESGEYQSLIKFEGPVSDQDIRAIGLAHYPQENFNFNDVTQQDIDRLAASGSNQQGLALEESDTAYEASLIQKATDSRQAKERMRLLTQYARGAKKLFTLIQLFATDEELIEVVGEEGRARFQSWDRQTISGEFSFKFNPDSSVRVDEAQQRERMLRFINLVSNNRFFNQLEVAGLLADAFGMDRIPLVRAPEPTKPEPPKATFSIRGDDLNPASPQYEGVRLFLQSQYGVELPQAMPMEPPIVSAPMGIEPVSKHAQRLTGKLPGPGPM